MKHKYLALVGLIRSLISICDDGKTGTMLVTSDHHSIQIKVDKGKIIGASDKHSRNTKIESHKAAGIKFDDHPGLTVLRTLKHLKKLGFSFSEGFLRPQHEPSFFNYPGIESNNDIFAHVGIELADFNISTEKKILIIDDSKIARRVARETLLEYNYRVIEAEDGMQGLAIIAKEKPALILLDIVMPQMDGYRVLSLIKNNKEFKEIPVIMLTSRDKLFDKIKGKMSDANEYLTKPFITKELIGKVTHYLG
ncbi:response regulator [Candidatus Venteria ishoeyi]|uniref:Putative transcriptional regulatory protein YedW n=1 Tax=Candidatus Venteria ishoeyi TaxID=1899563 RepID=A0A1H6F4Q9_9GAMM|nr:response regulator [Candidatus Venteria ishoeyi]SEH05120.1 putative transcriptional regulatory protein YedW [Candidatus Venteria ishoeyi]